MIAIVIVSHSREVADGLKRLADAMSQEDVPIFAAGGMDEEDNPLGTDAILIFNALQEAVEHDGVLVFADLGSAQLNAETAIDLLDDDQKQKVRFCEAPLVEGVLAAVVASGSGADMDAVAADAQASYAPPAAEKSSAEPEPTHSENAIYAEYDIVNAQGLHARPAARLVGAIAKLDADVLLCNRTAGSKSVNAKSINRLMMIQVRGGHRIGVSADGPDAQKVQDAIAKLVADQFGETGATVAPVGVPDEKSAPMASSVPTDKASKPDEGESPETLPAILSGISVADGFAVGPVAWAKAALAKVEKRTITKDDISSEQDRFEQARAAAKAEIQNMVSQSGDGLSQSDAGIFDAHLLFIEDPELIDAVKGRIKDDLVCAEYAWQEAVDELRTSYEQLDDPLLRARGDDLGDVGARVMRVLTGQGDDTQSFDDQVVLCFEEIAPSDVMGLDRDNVVGICVATGNKTSHAGILASGLGIPVIFDLGPALSLVKAGDRVLLDGGKATVATSPSDEDIANLQSQRDAWKERQVQAQKVRFDPAVTRDGVKVRVAANMAGVAEAKGIVDAGAEEVGLFRTEFLYMDRADAPDEDAQFKAYHQAVTVLDGRPLTVRTMDIGGDKPVPYLDRPSEENPNLGWRGVRFSLDNDPLFQVQLRAILRAAAAGPVRIMFPMVSTLNELSAAKSALDRARKSLDQDGIEYGQDVEVGIMVEVPSAAELAPVLGSHVDFFSIGTNDLTQYVMASDRGNPKTKALFNPLQPSVLRTISRVIDAGKKADIWTGMCGAMAGDRMAMPILLGLGLDEFSMSPYQIPEFKLDFAKLNQSDCADLAKEVLGLETVEQIEKRIHDFWDAA
ncbi:phosphoenolpyruvate--protein phosphotransferase [Thalassospira sp. MA62]|nr:phosphoenolpyruvate--protein phosphotransferase [Thalassospira sp. MA62]